MKKDIGAALSSPTGWILAGGLVYVAYKLVKALLSLGGDINERLKDVSAGFNTQPSSNPTDMPPGPPPQGKRLTAEILEPANNGIAERGTIDRKFKVVVRFGNPGDYAVAAVRVKVRMVPRSVGEPEELQSGQQLQLPARQSVVREYWFHWFSFQRYDGIASVEIDGRSVAAPALFTLE